MDLSLVVMAAGLGSRFGGTKQLVSVGPDGETFLDFAIRDAAEAGVSRVVLIVRTEIEDDVRRHVSAQHPGLAVEYVLQDEHGPPRPKPWGTGHAVLTASRAVSGAFLVCNADDYYGRSTYREIVSRMMSMDGDEAFLAGFRLDLTLPGRGAVSRGICTVESGRLMSVVEHHGIARRGGSITATDPPATLADDAVTSMNLWAFPPAIFPRLGSDFDAFLTDHGDDERAEFLLPTVVTAMMEAGELKVGVVPTDESWIGVTNPDDLGVARRRIAGLRTA